MPTRLLLDGEDLAGLMHRVRTEMGPGAVVVKAERVRSGGVAGFFAKEHFELTVEVPDARSRIPRRSPLPVPVVATPPRPQVGPPAVGIAALLEAAEAAEEQVAGRAPAPSFVGSFVAEPAVPVAVPEPDAGPRVSTDAHTFASLLASIDDMAETPAALKAPVPAAASAAAAAVSAEAASAAEPAVHPGATSTPVLPARFAPRGAVVTPVRLGPLFPGSGIADVVRPAKRTGGGDRRALLALGVPAALLGDGPLDETMPLSDLLTNLGRPPALLRTPGAIIAVVGESVQALAVAAQLAERVRQDPHDVVLAGEMPAVAGHGRRLLSPSAAARHRARIADGDQVSIVALGVGQLLDDWHLAAELLAQLGPDQAWAVVDARRKPNDLRAWLRAVGGARTFDVAAAAAVHETQEPGTVLGLGLPVGWIDGLPATPVVWAAVLSERLDIGARWD